MSSDKILLVDDNKGQRITLESILKSAGFEVTTNKVTLLARSGAQTELPLQDKRDVAQRILDAVEHDLT